MIDVLFFVLHEQQSIPFSVFLFEFFPQLNTIIWTETN